MGTTSDKVMVAYVHPTTVNASFHRAFLDMLVYDLSTDRHLADGGGWADYDSGPNVASARNTLVQHFLDDTTADWMLSIDTDIVFPPSIVHDLVASAHAVSATVMGGLYFGLGPDDGRGVPVGVFPQLFLFPTGVEDGLGSLLVPIPQPRGPEQVGATGAGMILIHRDALAAVREAKFSSAFPWFQETERGGRIVGEDIELCVRLAQVGHPVWVDTSVEVKHCKELYISSSIFGANAMAWIHNPDFLVDPEKG